MRRWLPPGNQLLYSFGTFGFNIVHQTVTLWIIYFYAPPEGSGRTVLVPIGLLGVLLGLGRVIEAFDDPAIGHWSDVTRSRWGRRLPFIVGATPFLVVAFVFLWTPPTEATPWSAVYAFVLIQVYFFFGSMAHQPYEAVLAEIARTPTERVRLSSWKVTFGLLGAGIGLIGSGLLIDRFGFAAMAAILGVPAAAGILTGAVGVRHLPLPESPDNSLPLWEGLRRTGTNRQFLVFVCSEVLFYLGLHTLTQVLPYFVTVVLGQSEGQVAWFTAVFSMVALVSLPGVNWLSAKRSKAFTYRLAMLVLALLLPGLFFVGGLPGLDPFLQGLGYVALLGVPMSALFVLPNPIIGDIIDDDETRTGRRREGVYYGVEETLNKLGFALSAALLGFVLETFGYSAEQPLGIRLLGPIAAIGVLIGFGIFTVGYRLPDQVERPSRDERRG